MDGSNDLLLPLKLNLLSLKFMWINRNLVSTCESAVEPMYSFLYSTKQINKVKNWKLNTRFGNASLTEIVEIVKATYQMSFECRSKWKSYKIPSLLISYISMTSRHDWNSYRPTLSVTTDRSAMFSRFYDQYKQALGQYFRCNNLK